jgi:hypothetical protein
MAAVPFDTLKLARRLESAGLSTQQAGDMAEALAEAMSGAEPAIKSDLNTPGEAVHAEIAGLERSLRSHLGGRIDALETRIVSLRAELKAGIELARRDTIIWSGGIIVIAVGVIPAAMRLLVAGHP